MPKAIAKDGTSLHPVPAATPDDLAFITVATVTTNLRPSGYLGSREEIQGELDYIAAVARTFHELQPDQVLRMCAAFTARLTELKVLLVRHEALDRRYLKVRTQQVEAWLLELERQGKTASRLIEVARQDLALMGRI